MFRSKETAPRRVLKKGIDAEESRRKRGDGVVELRKAQREENLQKKRAPPAPKGQDPKDTSVTPTVSAIPSLLQDVSSTDPMRQFQGTRHFRKLLSIQDNPPIQAVIDSGVLPRLIQFLKAVSNPALQFEAAWALTNVASGTREQTKAVIDLGAIPVFVHLLISPNKDVKEQAVWALGNIAGDSAPFRDLVLQCQALGPLVRCCATIDGVPPPMTLLRNATWAISNLCRGKPQPNFEVVSKALPCLNYLLTCTDTEVLTDACWAISYLTDDTTTTNSKIQAVLDSGAAQRVAKLLGHPSTSVQTPALRAVGNIVTGSDKQTSTMLDSGCLALLLPLLSSPKRGIRKEACWTLSNITAGTEGQIQAVIDANCIPSLIQLLRSDEFNVQKEATWAISNITNNGKAQHMRYLVKQGVLPPLVDMLRCNDAKIMMVALEGIENILKVGQSDAIKTEENTYAAIIEECGGVDKLEALQTHENESLYQKALDIMQTYFQCEEEEEDKSLAPQTVGSEFTFGSSFGSQSQGGTGEQMFTFS